MTTTLTYRHLFGPGPSNCYPEAISALGNPVLGHLDPLFLEIMDSACQGLRQVWGTTNSRTLPLSGTGSAGMEAAFVNAVGPGDVAVVAVNGMFGARMCEVARRTGAQVVRVEHPWGTPIDPERVAAAHPSPKVIAAVHAETSTGVLSDIAALGQLKGDALLIADAVTSIGGLELYADKWGIDVGYAGTQKCLGVPPGLSPFTISDAAFELRIKDPQSWYLDLGLLGGYVGSASGSRRTYHHTAPVTMIASLEAGVNRVLQEGLGTVQARHVAAGLALQDGLEEMGLDLFAAAGSRLPSLTTVKVPDGVDSAAVRAYLLERFNIEIGAGVGEFASSVWRIGMMGPNANPASVTLVLGALKEALAKAGR
ncbi:MULTISPECIES: pyridoxal-phosphate-dependent aminotransferase family protein [Arthrobacter]|uniref:Alanine--glyoxylate aminotransferase n=1 Tax=Arthrobacter psychrochitiniphilus TaxID=291045 RepID=A0A2V3DWQ5_9MICC|nr:MULTISPECIES: alanine--glyoxylate aminotransferase family protein [Arthrobacter]NYG16378.1 alanine-glyoxylate transaminase/serine-glyoxylate transaminase/serine-pyruvate transaminase [Arthrobacter psychrochitiniphilus]PXA69467.1 alanine--glyoxylate aminotransferase [Arthrobacter psychrochitiniphilus]